MTDYSPEIATTRRLIANLLATLDQGLTEAGLPLTDEQRTFLLSAADHGI